MTSVMILLVSVEERPWKCWSSKQSKATVQTKSTSLQKLLVSYQSWIEVIKSTLMIMTISHPGAYISLSCTSALELLKTLTCHSDFPRCQSTRCARTSPPRNLQCFKSYELVCQLVGILTKTGQVVWIFWLIGVYNNIICIPFFWHIHPSMVIFIVIKS